MYVRWKKRPMTRTQRSCGQHRIGGHSLTTVLVESRRFRVRAMMLLPAQPFE